MTTRKTTQAAPADGAHDRDARADGAHNGDTSADDARADYARGGDAHDAREAFVFRAGARLFAVYAEEVETTAEHLRPAPLPFAPPTVLGVVPLRGRMRTALDPRRLLDAPAPPDARPTPADAQAAPSKVQNGTPDAQAAHVRASDATPDAAHAAQAPPRLFVALAGDEQLALACDSVVGRVALRASQLERPPDSPEHARAIFEHEGRPVILLDPARLFDAAMRGTDRRRRRT